MVIFMEDYRFNSDTLLHSVSFDLYKLYSIMQNGILSKNEAEKQGINFSRNHYGYNFDDYISMTKPFYTSSDDENSCYRKYVERGISLIIEDTHYISNDALMYFNHADEVFVKDKVPKENIKGLMVPEKYMSYQLSDLPMLPIEAKSYVNIKHCTDNLIRFLKSLGHKVDMEYYNDILREMYETLQALKVSKNDEELLNDYKEAKCALDDFISVEVENCFKKLLSKDEVLLSDAISYINNKTLNLKIYNAKLLKRGNFR